MCCAAACHTLAQIAGHALSNIFLDALSVDVERVQRVNQTLNLIPPAALAQSQLLPPIDLLVIAPSQRIDGVAARHVGTPCRGVPVFWLGRHRRSPAPSHAAEDGVKDGLIAGLLCITTSKTKKSTALKNLF
jgi:hypothetical protein